jgi:hypothetical protein
MSKASPKATHLNQPVLARPLIGNSQLRQISASELLRVPHSLQGTRLIGIYIVCSLGNLYQNYRLPQIFGCESTTKHPV